MEAAKGWVPVRVTDMAGVNLSVYRFDFDLTFAVLLMNADGTIYHTFAGRDWTHADSHLSMKVLVQLLRNTLTEHADYQKAPKPPKLRKPFTIEQYPSMARQIRQGKTPECMHCHMIGEHRYRSGKQAGQADPAAQWQWPDPMEAGLQFDKEQQTRAIEVAKKSAAAKAGLQRGDHIARIDGRAVVTFGDVARALHQVPDAGGTLTLTVQRGDQELEKKLRLKSGWKRPDPKLFAWRSSKWPMDPKPGFGGPKLTGKQLELAGLPPNVFAFRVQYIVTWGPDSYTGRNAAQAGIRKGDVVFSIGGKRDFESPEHFHAWFRLTRRAGQTVPIELMRNGKRQVIQLPVVVK